MTDRLKGVYVSFSSDLREDDAENIISAIRMVKGVEEIVPNQFQISDIDARLKVRVQLRDLIQDFLKKLS